MMKINTLHAGNRGVPSEKEEEIEDATSKRLHVFDQSPFVAIRQIGTKRMAAIFHKVGGVIER